MNTFLKKHFLKQLAFFLSIFLVCIVLVRVNYTVVALMVAVFSIIPVSKIVSLFKIKKFESRFNNYTMNRVIGAYEETSPIFYDSRKKHAKGVLLIHGFSASPNELLPLSDALRSKGLIHYVPLLTGYGLQNYHLLENIDETDWARDVIQAYDLLSQTVDQIDVIGHSMGGMVALYLAQHRRVGKIVLTSPYIIPKRKNSIHKKLLTMPWLGEMLMWLQPFYSKKSSKPKENQKRFAQNILPLRAVQTIWKMQDMIDYGALKNASIHILFGGEDTTVENQATIEYLERMRFDFTYEVYNNAGHNLLDSGRSDEVVEHIIRTLTLPT